MANVLYTQLSPLVYNQSAPVAPTLTVKLDSAPTSVSVYIQQTAALINLTPDATGTVFTGTIPTNAFSGLTAAQVNRAILGKLNVISGPTPQQSTLIADVLTPSIPAATIHSVTAGIQRTEHLVNLHLPLNDDYNALSLHPEAITQPFYAQFDDIYDFLLVILARDYPASRNGFGTHNTVQGIGMPPSNQDPGLGSAGRLQGFVWFPYPTGFDGIAPATFHEIAHRWMMQLNFGMYAAARPHWPIGDLAEDIMGYSNLTGSKYIEGQFSYTIAQQPNGDYQLTPSSAPKTFSDLAQYLMGMRPASQVGTHFAFTDQTQPLPPNNGPGTLHGPITNLNIADVITAVGARVPDSTKSQKCFRAATLLVTTDGLADADTMQFYDYFASRLSATTPQAYADGSIQNTALPFPTVTNGGCLHSRIKMHILVDSSRDGGVWWFPQTGPFNSGATHQGKPLADYLRGQGHTVAELPRPTTITAALLSDYDIVIRANGHGTYSSSELSAYDEWVQGGGMLLLLADHHASDGLAVHFGIHFAGITDGQRELSTFTAHAITAGVAPIFYGAGSGILSQPSAATILARLSATTFLDLNNDGIKEPSEPSAPAGLGVMPLGKGQIIFCGDTNLWEKVPQPLVKNTLAWFAQLA
jgi:hypothetical protein